LIVDGCKEVAGEFMSESREEDGDNAVEDVADDEEG
jgi:hypothetical protein